MRTVRTVCRGRRARLHVHRAARRHDHPDHPRVGDHAADPRHAAARARRRNCTGRCARCAPPSTRYKDAVDTGQIGVDRRARPAAKAIRRISRRWWRACRRRTTRPGSSSSSCAGCRWIRSTHSTEWGMRSYQDKPDSIELGRAERLRRVLEGRRHGARRDEVQGLVRNRAVDSRRSRSAIARSHGQRRWPEQHRCLERGREAGLGRLVVSAASR